MYYILFFYHGHVTNSQLYADKINLKIIHKISLGYYIIMHKYKLNCLIADDRSCTQNLKVVAILFLFSLSLFIVLFFLMFLSLPFVYIYIYQESSIRLSPLEKIKM